MKREWMLAGTLPSSEKEVIPTEVLTFSDGNKLPRTVVHQTLIHINEAIKEAGSGAAFLLYDLRDKSLKDDEWTPCPNPFCETMCIMKQNALVDDKGHMLPSTKSIIQDCVVGEDLDIHIKRTCLSEKANKP